MPRWDPRIPGGRSTPRSHRPIQQAQDALRRLNATGGIEKRDTIPAYGMYVGAPFHQLTHDVIVLLKKGVVHGCPATLVTGIEVCTLNDERIHARQMPCTGGMVQGSLTQSFDPHVVRNAVIEKPSECLCLTMVGGDVDQVAARESVPIAIWRGQCLRGHGLKAAKITSSRGCLGNTERVRGILEDNLYPRKVSIEREACGPEKLLMHREFSFLSQVGAG